MEIMGTDYHAVRHSYGPVEALNKQMASNGVAFQPVAGPAR